MVQQERYVKTYIKQQKRECQEICVSNFIKLSKNWECQEICVSNFIKLSKN